MSKQFLKRVFNLFMEKGLKDGYFKNWSGIKNCVILNFSASLPGKLRSVTSHVLSGSALCFFIEYSMFLNYILSQNTQC